MPGMTDVTPPPLPAGTPPATPNRSAGDKKVGEHRARLDQYADLLNIDDSGGLPAWGGKHKAGQRLKNKYMKQYNWLSGQDYDVSGYGSFDQTTGDWIGPGGTTGGDPAPGGGEPPGPTPEEDPWSEENPHGPAVEDVIATVQEGLPPGFDINSEEGARTLEVLYPYVKDAYNQSMQQKAVTTGLESLGELKDDPIFSTLSAAVMDKVNNPFTFDDETVGLMRSSIADQAATSEAALSERLRSMGATQGIDPSSPLYASMAQQAAMSRDINLANLERDLDIKLATQRQHDKESAIAMGSQYAGGYQTLMGQRYGDLANIQRGAQMNNPANPFEGVWDSVVLGDEINQGGPGGSTTGAVIQGAGSGAATGTMIAPGWGTLIGGVAGGASAYYQNK